MYQSTRSNIIILNVFFNLISWSLTRKTSKRLNRIVKRLLRISAFYKFCNDIIFSCSAFHHQVGQIKSLWLSICLLRLFYWLVLGYIYISSVTLLLYGSRRSRSSAYKFNLFSEFSFAVDLAVEGRISLALWGLINFVVASYFHGRQ